MPTDKKANLGPKTFVNPKAMRPPMISKTIGKIILLFLNLDLQIKS